MKKAIALGILLAVSTTAQEFYNLSLYVEKTYDPTGKSEMAGNEVSGYIHEGNKHIDQFRKGKPVHAVCQRKLTAGWYKARYTGEHEITILSRPVGSDSAVSSTCKF